MITEELLNRIFNRYFALADEEKCSGYGLDTSDIDYDAFIQALNEIISEKKG
jgi:hypothetical protein